MQLGGVAIEAKWVARAGSEQPKIELQVYRWGGLYVAVDQETVMMIIIIYKILFAVYICRHKKKLR